MTQPGKKYSSSPKIEMLLAKAHKQGYLSTEAIEEVQAAMSEDPPGAFERLLSALEEGGIEISHSSAEEPATPGMLPERPSELPEFDSLAGDDAISLYLKEMALTPLLSVDEELSLAKRIARAILTRRELARPEERSKEQIQELELAILDGKLARARR